MNTILTVSQLNSYLSFKIKDDYRLRGIFLKGEVSNFVNHYKSGHLYFSLKDNNSVIKAIMFSSNACNLGFVPENGMNVIVQGSIQVYERDGTYQIYVTDIQPDGTGVLYFAYEQLKEKLLTEGIFDEKYKKSLPLYPDKIAVVTAKCGAALQDIINVVTRRYPVAKLIIYPCLVQGKDAPLSISNSIKNADEDNNDVIIVARGGGSFEDLNGYNTEIVARTIFECNTPLISAVGHETDITISDFVADKRAPTPSASAEIVCPDKNNLIELLKKYRIMMYNCILESLNKKSDIVVRYENKFKTSSVNYKIIEEEQKLKAIKQQIYFSVNKMLMIKGNQIKRYLNNLDSLSPSKVLLRGYSIVDKDNKIIKNSDDLKKGDEVNITFGKGQVKAEIISINLKPDNKSQEEKQKNYQVNNESGVQIKYV